MHGSGLSLRRSCALIGFERSSLYCKACPRDDRELCEKLKAIAKSSNQDVEKVRDFYKREGLLKGLEIKLLENKTLDFLIGKATIVEISKNSKS